MNSPLQHRRNVKGDRHIVRLNPAEVLAATSFNNTQRNFRDPPYQAGYWKEHLLRIQTTSRPEGRKLIGPADFQATARHRQSQGNHLPQMHGQYGKSDSCMSPESPNLQAFYLSSRDSRGTSKGRMGQQLNRISMPNSINSTAHQSRGAGLNYRNQRQKEDCNGPSGQQQSIIEEDSLYMLEKPKTTHNQYQHQNPTSRRSVTNDSLFNSMYNTQDQQCASMDCDPLELSVSNKVNSIYSNSLLFIYVAVKDQIQVNNILHKKFPDLKSRAQKRQQRNSQPVQDVTSNFSASASFDAGKVSQRKQSVYSRDAQNLARHAIRQKQLMQQHALAKLTRQTSENSEDANAKSIASKQVSNKRNTSVDFNNADQSLYSKTVINTPNSGKEMKTPSAFFTRATHNSIFQQNQSQGSVVDGGSLQLKSRRTRNIEQSINYVCENRRNLQNDAVTRLHTQFDLWDRPLPPKEGVTEHRDDQLLKKDNPTTSEQKDLLVIAMQRRVKGDCSMNANEILASAGITNHRIDAAMAKQQNVSKSTDFGKGGLNSSGQKQPFFQGDLSKQEQVEVAKLVAQTKLSKIEREKKKNSASNAWKMIGRSNFDIPDNDALRDILTQSTSVKKRKMITQIAQMQDDMEGKITLKDYDKKVQLLQSREVSPVKNYVTNFSEIKHVLQGNKYATNEMLSFGSVLKNKLQSNVEKTNQRRVQEKQMLRDEIIRDYKEAGLEGDELELALVEYVKKHAWFKEKPNVLNQCLDEETKLLSQMGQNFEDKVAFISRMGQNEVEHQGKGVINKSDPKVAFYQQCKKEIDLALPVLEKVYNKTLVLQEYTLSKGHAQGIAKACQFFDHKFVNRIFFNNSGIDDQEFSEILNGMNQLKDFKSIIYKANVFAEQSLCKLEPLLMKRVPNHLQELKLIDCQMLTSCSNKLLDLLISTNCQLQVLALVKTNLNEVSIDKIIYLMSQSSTLKELDLSWSKQTTVTWRKFLLAVQENRQLTYLNLSYNQLLEEEPKRPDLDDADQSTYLSRVNQEAISCFKNFIKFNLHLVHVNLEGTGLNEAAIRYIVSLLRKSQALRCLHLSANEGLNSNLIRWVQKRIHAKTEEEPIDFISFKMFKQEANRMSKTQSLIGRQLFAKQNLSQVEEYRNQNQWTQIREGLKLRQVINSKRINEASALVGSIDMEGSFLSDKLVLTRHLGIKYFMPGSAQWVVAHKKQDDCWHCSQHILTIFLWTPRIGQLTSSKNKEKCAYYEQQVGKTIDTAQNCGDAPMIAADFNGWHFKKMQNVVEFCYQHDLQPPNFEQECIDDSLIRSDHAGRLDGEDREVVRQRAKQYYESEWQSVLMHTLKFERPQVANAHQLNKEALKSDSDSTVYIHIDWVKPGKHTYLVHHVSEEAASEGENEPKSAFNFFVKPKVTKAKTVKKKIYMHEMLSTFREEEIPEYYNPRHMGKSQMEKHVSRQVWKEWQLDTSELRTLMLHNDNKWWQIKEEFCNSQKEYNNLEQLVSQNWLLLTEIYHYLRSKTDVYPFIADYTLRMHFYDKAIMKEGYESNHKNFDLLVIKLNNHRKGAERVRIDRSFLICFLIYLAHQLFADPEPVNINQESPDNSQAQIQLQQQVRIVKAFQMLIDKVLQKFHRSLDTNTEEFRKSQQSKEEICLLFSMNESNLRNLYGVYSARNRGKGIKDANFQFITMNDCFDMIKKDAKILVTKKQIKTAFILCQMSQIEEQSPEAVQNYQKLLYIEFLEFLSRVAEMYFEGSEMEGLELEEKLEYLLDELLPTVGCKRVKQETVIQEFSESDDDY